MPTVQRCSKIRVNKTNPNYHILDKLSHLANNIYNRAVYSERQYMCQTKNKSGYTKQLTYSQLDNQFKLATKNNENMLYTQAGTHFCQQLLRDVANIFKVYHQTQKAYFKQQIKSWQHPRWPGYHEKGGRTSFKLDNQTIKHLNRTIKWTTNRKNSIWWKKALKHDLIINPTISQNKILHIQVNPKKYYFDLLVIYETTIPKSKVDNGRYLGIDPGSQNLLTVASNTVNTPPIIIPGGPVNTLNYWYNKRIQKLQSNVVKVNHEFTSHKIDVAFTKRYCRINKYFYEACNYIIDYVINHKINTIIVGNGCTMSKRKNKINNKLSNKVRYKFNRVPYRQLLDILKYKCENVGINYIETEESYTSQTSFLDNELPIKENGNQARKDVGRKHNIRRIKRGLFKSDNGFTINADVNGALQIIKKVNMNAFIKVDMLKRCASDPHKVRLAYC